MNGFLNISPEAVFFLAAGCLFFYNFGNRFIFLQKKPHSERSKSAYARKTGNA